MLRDEKGRFVKGNKASPGRKPRTEEREVIAALEGACPESVVLGKLAQAIGNGEEWAIKLYLAYKWGSPRQRVENDVSGGLTVQVVYDQIDDPYEEAAQDAEDSPA